ncbi:hypothetical protein AcV7_004284 [Taiwanofungus camphoratus]|nr:hypothetical protein AcV7_004284 [Antrodia cinnamomea]
MGGLQAGGPSGRAGTATAGDDLGREAAGRGGMSDAEARHVFIREARRFDRTLWGGLLRTTLTEGPARGTRESEDGEGRAGRLQKGTAVCDVSAVVLEAAARDREPAKLWC